MADVSRGPVHIDTRYCNYLVFDEMPVHARDSSFRYCYFREIPFEAIQSVFYNCRFRRCSMDNIELCIFYGCTFEQMPELALDPTSMQGCILVDEKPASYVRMHATAGSRELTASERKEMMRIVSERPGTWLRAGAKGSSTR